MYQYTVMQQGLASKNSVTVNGLIVLPVCSNIFSESTGYINFAFLFSCY